MTGVRGKLLKIFVPLFLVLLAANRLENYFLVRFHESAKTALYAELIFFLIATILVVVTVFLVGSKVEAAFIGRTRAEEALQKSEDLFRNITSSALDGIIVLDNNGQIVFWNEAAEKLFGYTIEELKGRAFHEVLVPTKYLGDYKKGWGRFKGTGEGAAVGKVLELSALRKDGTEFSVELSISAIKIDNKWCSVGMVKDISERKRLEDDLKKRLDELERFNKITMDREKRVIELKEEIERLKGKT